MAAKITLTTTAVVVWLIPIMYLLFVEGYMLGAGSGVPLTTVLRTARFDVVGRYLVVPFLTWAYWHIVLRSAGFPARTAWDFIPIVLGVALAAVTGRFYPLGGVVG